MVLEKILEELKEKNKVNVFLENKFEKKVINVLEKSDHIEIFLEKYENFLLDKFNQYYCEKTLTVPQHCQLRKTKQCLQEPFLFGHSWKA